MRRYMIRTRRDLYPSDEELFSKLEKNGLRMDRGFGPVALNPEGSQVLVRGRAPRGRLRELSDSLGLEFFPEARIGS